MEEPVARSMLPESASADAPVRRLICPDDPLPEPMPVEIATSPLFIPCDEPELIATLPPVPLLLPPAAITTSPPRDPPSPTDKTMSPDDALAELPVLIRMPPLGPADAEPLEMSIEPLDEPPDAVPSAIDPLEPAPLDPDVMVTPPPVAELLRPPVIETDPPTPAALLPTVIEMSPEDVAAAAPVES